MSLAAVKEPGSKAVVPLALHLAPVLQVSNRQQRVYLYRPGMPVEILDGPESVSGDPVATGLILDLREVWDTGW